MIKRNMYPETAETRIGRARANDVEAWLKLNLVLDSNGFPINNVQNVIKIFESIKPYSGFISMDEDRSRLLVRESGNKIRYWKADDEIYLTYRLQREFRFHSVTLLTVSHAIRAYIHLMQNNEWNII
jgi:hypothetical protein